MHESRRLRRQGQETRSNRSRNGIGEAWIVGFNMKRSKSLYDFPGYYDVAFSFRDIPHEAQVFDECFRRYSKIRVRRVLELGSGTSPHLEEWEKRGIEYVGIDTSKIMLSYANKKARNLGIDATLLKGDMRNFSIKGRVDFAYTMLGSLFAKTTSDLRSHLRSVARALNPGGLYFLDWCVNLQWGEETPVQRWTVDKENVRVRMQFRSDILNRANQIVRNTLTANVNDSGKRLHLESVDDVRTVFPQEFLLLAGEADKFEFVGWWNNWNLREPANKATRISRPIALVRRK